LIATQNPTDQAGTYPLPESQLDRFTMRLSLGAPSRNSEIEILRLGDTRLLIQDQPQILSAELLLAHQKAVQAVHVSDSLLSYVQGILAMSRQQAKRGGLSPRAGLLLLNSARAWAFLEGRPMVLPEDVKAIGKAVLSHRLTDGQLHRLSAGEELVDSILAHVKVP
jgi:MoxR-like ATPase